MATPVSNCVELSGDPLIDGLVQGSAWQFAPGPQVLSFSLSTYRSTVNAVPTVYSWSAAGRAAIESALQAWSDVAHLAFSESGSGGDVEQSTADLAFAPTGLDLLTAVGAVGLAAFPSPEFADTLLAGFGQTRAEYPRPEGDVYLDDQYPGFHLNPGGYGYEVILHEIGHALGLKHPDDDGGNGRPTFAALGIAALDSQYATLMSNDLAGFPYNYGNAATPMPLDILAIQSIYGANLGFHAGDDRYALADDGRVRSLWDAGGDDTIDASGLTGVTLDLREGRASPFGSGGSAIAIAYGAHIEHAIGTPQFDTLIGNAAANRLDGGHGGDTLVGGGGSDTLDGGAGFDVDTASYATSMDDFVITSGPEAEVRVADRQSASGDVDTLRSIERLVFSDGALRVAQGHFDYFGESIAGELFVSQDFGGAESDDHLRAGDGRQTLIGWWGADRLLGGAGDDVFLFFSRKDSELATPDTLLDFADGDTLDFYRMGGITLREGAYAFAGSVAGTRDQIRADAGIDDAAVFFSDGSDGYLYIKGAGYATATSYDDMLVRLAGHLQPLDAADIALSHPAAPPPPTIAVAPLITDQAEGDRGLTLFSFSISVDGLVSGSLVVNWQTAPGQVGLLGPSLGLPGAGSDLAAPFPSGSLEFFPGDGAQQVDIAVFGDTRPEADEGFIFSVVGATYPSVIQAVIRNDDHAPGSDLNADGKTDLVWYHAASGGLFAHRMDGSAVAAEGYLRAGTPAGWEIVESGADFDGDGRTDLLWWNPASRSAYVELLDGLGTRSEGFVAQGVPPGWEIAGARGDHDGDGRSDVLWQHDASHASYLFLMAGTTVAGEGFARENAGSAWRIAESAGDYDGDGRSDILWRNADSGAVYIDRMAGHDIAGEGLVIDAVSADWQLLDARSDRDGDGRSDLLWYHAASGGVYGFLMDGTTIAAEGHVTPGVPAGWTLVETAGDYDGDARADLLWQQAGSHATYLFLMAGLAIHDAGHERLSAGAGWTIADARGDHDGDGRSDLLWRNADRGEVYVDLLAGTAILGEGLVAQGVGADWALA